MKRIRTVLLAALLLPLAAGGVCAQSFNTQDGTTYGTADSAFKAEWNSTSDTLVMKATSAGSLGAGITWTDGLTMSSAGRVLTQFDNDSGTCTSAKNGRLRYNGVATWEYCNGSAWTPFESAAGGGGWTADCSDYTSTQGLGAVPASVSATAYVPGSRIKLTVGNLDNTGVYFASSSTRIITGCVSGQGSPTLGTAFSTNSSNTDNDSGESEIPLIANSLVSLYVTSPSSGNYTGTITYGTAKSLGYTVTYSSYGRIMFKTSTSYTGSQVASLANADAICQARADAGTATSGLGLTWKAVISDGTTNASARLTVAYPIVTLLNGLLWSANIWSTTPDSTAFGRITNENQVINAVNIWTGSTNAGVASATHCTNWTSNSAGISGGYGLNNTSWLFFGAVSCNGARNLLCISQ